MSNTIKITKLCVDARTPYRTCDNFSSLLNRVNKMFNDAVKEAGSKYPDHRSKFHCAPFYDEHDTEKVYADEWLLPEAIAKATMDKVNAMLQENERLLSSSSYIKVDELGSEEVVLNEVTEADRLAQKYADKSPALFTKAVRRIDGHKSCFIDYTLESHIKKFIKIEDFEVRGVGFYSTNGAKAVYDFDLLTYVYNGVSADSRKRYIEYARAYPDDVIIAEDYKSDKVFPKDIPLGNVSKADFLEAYWKLADELRR
jgi:hypothetical protein